jgi:RNA-binding protein 39
LTAEERLRKEQERELKELERDLRTIFVYQLHPKAELKDMFAFFSVAGKVADIRIITDRYTKRSKGFGYVEFSDKGSILPALSLNGQLLKGHPVLVKPSESEKNAAAQLAKTQAAMVTAAGPNPNRLYVGNLHHNVQEKDLRDIFAPFGALEFVQMHMDTDKGYAFVQYQSSEPAKMAMSQLNGLEIAGRAIKVRHAHGRSNLSARGEGPCAWRVWGGGGATH